jgi:hypothetical protein
MVTSNVHESKNFFKQARPEDIAFQSGKPFDQILEVVLVLPLVAAAMVFSMSAMTLSDLAFGKKTVTEIECYPQDGKTRCCGSEVDDKLIYGYTGVTYCTTCDNTTPPSNCTPSEKITKESQQPTTLPEPGPPGTIEQPPTNVAPSKTCPDGSAPDADGKCPPVTQGPTDQQGTTEPPTKTPSTTDQNKKPQVKEKNKDTNN